MFLILYPLNVSGTWLVVRLKDNLMVFAFCFLFCVYFSSYARNYCHFASNSSKFQNFQKLLALPQFWTLICTVSVKSSIFGVWLNSEKYIIVNANTK